MQMLMQAAESRARVKVKKETERQKREEEAWGGVHANKGARVRER